MEVRACWCKATIRVSSQRIGETLALRDNRGRLVHTNSYAGAPSLAQQFLRVTEVMYHPSLMAGNTNGAEEFEYIELKNISTNQSLNLAGVRFINGVEFDFTSSGAANMPPGQRFLVVKNGNAFGDRCRLGTWNRRRPIHGFPREQRRATPTRGCGPLR